ncbi:MAG: anion permease [Chlamydiota bacterium]
MSRVLNRKVIFFLISLIIGIIVWSLPPPEGVSVQGIHMLGIFIFTVLGIILRSFPIGTVAILGLTITVVTKTLDFGAAFNGFIKPVVWLVIIAFFISRGFIKTGLGERIAYLVVKYMGKSTLGMGYGLVLTDLILAPAIPSVTARLGGIVYPIVTSLARVFKSEPYSHPKRLGSFLMKTAFQGSVITSGMFLTSMAGNPLIADFASKVGIELSWGTWALAGIVPGLACIAVMPFFLYKMYPPEIKKTPDAREFAMEKLKELGPVRVQEWILIFTFCLLIILWIFSKQIGMEAVVAAMIGLCILLLTGVLKWDDVAREKGAWNMLMWFSILITMAGAINTLGLTNWFSTFVKGYVEGLNWMVAFGVLVLVYFYSHYFFASMVAHISSMYSPFLILSVAVGAPPMLAALLLAFSSNLFAGITHYGSGPAPIFFGSGYVKITSWWKLGFFVSVINITIFLTVGILWWKSLGLF